MHDIDDAPRPREHAYEIADLYESSFGPDPEVPVSVFAESLTKHAECAGFRCRLAYRDERADDEPLRVFYRRRGWVDVAEDGLGSDTLRVVMGRALRG